MLIRECERDQGYNWSTTMWPIVCSWICVPDYVCVCVRVLVCECWFERYKGSLPHSIGIPRENEYSTEQRREGHTVGAFIGLVPTGRNQGRVLAPINKQSQPSRGLAHYTKSVQREKEQFGGRVRDRASEREQAQGI